MTLRQLRTGKTHKRVVSDEACGWEWCTSRAYWSTSRCGSGLLLRDKWSAVTCKACLRLKGKRKGVR